MRAWNGNRRTIAAFAAVIVAASLAAGAAGG